MMSTHVSFNASPLSGDHFIVCGLGNLGQYCIFSVKQFTAEKTETTGQDYQVHVTAINREEPNYWEAEERPDRLVIGDCRDEEILRNAGIDRCRAILIVTGDESANIQAAIAVRKLNPQVRIVVRSSKQSLNDRLQNTLSNFQALDPISLPADAFALAGLGGEVLGFFNIGHDRFRVLQRIVEPGDSFQGMMALDLHRSRSTLKTQRLISMPDLVPDSHQHHRPITPTGTFYQWPAETQIQTNDVLIYLEFEPYTAPTPPIAKKSWIRSGLQRIQRIQPIGKFGKLREGWERKTWRDRIQAILSWLQSRRTRSIILASGALLGVCFWGLGTVLIMAGSPNKNLKFRDAALAGFVLIVGGYGDVFGGMDEILQPVDSPPDSANGEGASPIAPIPFWLRLSCVLINTFSLLFVLGALGLLIDEIINVRLTFLGNKRSALPDEGHIVIVGLRRVGQRSASLLQGYGQIVVGITDDPEDPDLLPKTPVLFGDMLQNLEQVNLDRARSIIAVTEDQMFNLELALYAREINPKINVVVRTYDQRFSRNIQEIVGDAKAMSAYALSAQMYAGAAFGEKILGLFRLKTGTVLVTEYRVEEGDTLNGKLLGQIAYGYGVVPVLYQKHTATEPEIFPPDKRLLAPDDRLVILATINGLRRIERGKGFLPRKWQVEAKPLYNESAWLDARNELSQACNTSLEWASDFINRLPLKVNLGLYDYQAYQLQKNLARYLPIQIKPLDNIGTGLKT